MIRTPHWGVHNNVLSSDLTLNLYCFLESLLKDHPLLRSKDQALKGMSCVLPDFVPIHIYILC